MVYLITQGKVGTSEYRVLSIHSRLTNAEAALRDVMVEQGYGDHTVESTGNGQACFEFDDVYFQLWPWSIDKGSQNR